MPIKKGDRVRIEYEAFLDDGRVFDSTHQHGFPMKLTVGDGAFLDVFEDALIGMKVGENKSIRLSPEDAYGEYSDDKVVIVKREKLPTKSELEIGTLLILNDPTGNEIPTKVLEFTETDVTLDFNHPLAGIALNYRITIIEVL